MNYPIKYQFAKDQNEKVININDLENTPEIRKKQYFCFSCNQPVTPVLGKTRQKHFRHLVSGVCSVETYLHNLSKRLFYQIYSQCLENNLSFDIELSRKEICVTCEDLDITCDLGKTPVRFSLTDYFPLIFLEQPCDGFIPDVLLLNENGEKIFIEFAVTHESTEEKLLYGNRVIEFDVSNEKSLQPIMDRLLSQTNPQIKFENFKSPKPQKVMRTQCNKKFLFFMLKNDGSAYILQDTPKKYRYRLNRGDISYSKLVTEFKYSIDTTYVNEVIDAHNEGCLIKNCFLCRYHAKNEFRDIEDPPIFCKFLKKTIKSTYAVSCQYYRPDSEVFKTYIVTDFWELNSDNEIQNPF